MNKTKGLLTINKSKDTLKRIRTIEDLKQALEQDLMRYESKITTKVKNSVSRFITTHFDEIDLWVIKIINPIAIIFIVVIYILDMFV